MQVAFPVHGPQTIILPISVHPDLCPVGLGRRQDLPELAGLIDRDIRVCENRSLGPSTVKDKQRLMLQQEPEVRRRSGEHPDPLVRTYPQMTCNPPEHCRYLTPAWRIGTEVEVHGAIDTAISSIAAQVLLGIPFRPASKIR